MYGKKLVEKMCLLNYIFFNKSNYYNGFLVFSLYILIIFNIKFRNFCFIFFFDELVFLVFSFIFFNGLFFKYIFLLILFVGFFVIVVRIVLFNIF